MTIVDTDPKLLGQLQRYKRRAKDQATRIVQLEHSRAQWKRRATEAAKERLIWRTRARAQYHRAELWKHRALTMYPVPNKHGGSPSWVERQEWEDYLHDQEQAFREREAS